MSNRIHEMRKFKDVLEVVVEERGVSGRESSETPPIPKVLAAVAATVERLLARNEKCLGNVMNCRNLTVFHGTRPPSISILKYLERIYKYTNCSPSCFLVGFVYIDRLVHKQPNIPLTSLNVHRLLVTSIMVATKFLDDVHYNNAFYARVGGISVAELNCLELDFIFRLDFRCQVSSNTFQSYCIHLERELLSAEQHVERTVTSFGNLANEEVFEQQKNLEDAQKRLLLFLDRNGSSVAAALATNNSEPPSR